MAGYTDNFGTALKALVTSLTAADLMDFNNLIFQQIFEPRDIRDTDVIITGVRNGAVLPVLNRKLSPDSFPFSDLTTCDVAECDLSNEYSSHTWEVAGIECKIPICMRSFDQDFLTFWRQCQLLTSPPDLDSAIIEYLQRVFVDNLRLGTIRAAYFADKSSASALYNKIDGIFAQLETQAGNIIDITENAGANYAAQALTGEKAYQYLEAMYVKAASEPWFDPANMEYKISKSMAAALVAYLNKAGRNAPGTCECIDPATATALQSYRMDGLFLFGIPVSVRYEWDQIVTGSSVLNNGTKWDDPHRAILSPKNNILIGTCSEDLINDFRVWYSNDDNKVYMQGSSLVGGGVPLLTDFVLAK